jgi:hypothetical protein
MAEFKLEGATSVLTVPAKNPVAALSITVTGDLVEVLDSGTAAASGSYSLNFEKDDPVDNLALAIFSVPQIPSGLYKSAVYCNARVNQWITADEKLNRALTKFASFDSYFSAPSLLLSESDNLATGTQTVNALAVSNILLNKNANHFFEFEVVSVGVNSEFGIVTEEISTSQKPSTTTNCIALKGSGAVHVSTVLTYTHAHGPLSNGDVVQFAVDFVNNKVWIGVNGTWGEEGDDPATNTGGIDINSYISFLLMPCFAATTSGESARLKTGITPLSLAAPSGFNDGFYQPLSIEEGAQYSQLSSRFIDFRWNINSDLNECSILFQDFETLTFGEKMATGKHYWEITLTSVTSTSNGHFMGITPLDSIDGIFPFGNDDYVGESSNAPCLGFRQGIPYLRNTAGSSTTGSTALGIHATNDVYMFAFDADLPGFWVGKNGTWHGDPVTATENLFDLAGGSDLERSNWFLPTLMVQTAGNGFSINVGDKPFAHSPPTGYGPGIQVSRSAIVPYFLPEHTGRGLDLTSDKKTMSFKPASGSSKYSSLCGLPVRTGKHYWEFKAGALLNGSSNVTVGLISLEESSPRRLSNGIGDTANTTGFQVQLRRVRSNNTGIFTGTAADVPEDSIIQVAYDSRANKVWFGVDNVWINSGDPETGTNGFDSLISGPIQLAVSNEVEGYPIELVSRREEYTYSISGFRPGFQRKSLDLDQLALLLGFNYFWLLNEFKLEDNFSTTRAALPSLTFDTSLNTINQGNATYAQDGPNLYARSMVVNNIQHQQTTSDITGDKAFICFAVKMQATTDHIFLVFGYNGANPVALRYDQANQSFGFSFTGGGDIYGIDAAAITDDLWHTVMLYVEGGDYQALRIWIDGEEVNAIQRVGTSANQAFTSAFQFGDSTTFNASVQLCNFGVMDKALDAIDPSRLAHALKTQQFIHPDRDIPSQLRFLPHLAHADISFSNDGLTLSHPTASSHRLALAHGEACRFGQFYYECVLDIQPGSPNGPFIGFVSRNHTSNTSFCGSSSTSWGYSASSGQCRTNNSNQATLSTASQGDTLMVAIDLDAGEIWFGLNGSWLQGNPETGASPVFSGIVDSLLPACSMYTTGQEVTFKFKISDFNYGPPQGFTEFPALSL